MVAESISRQKANPQVPTRDIVVRGSVFRGSGKVAVPIHTLTRALASLPRSLCTSVPHTQERHTHLSLIMFMSNFRVRDPLRPSFFELYAQQQLFPMLKPALHYAFSVRATRSTPPHSRTCMVLSVSGRTTHTRTGVCVSKVLAMRSRSWEVIANYTDEVFAAMQLVIERHYLTFYGTRAAATPSPPI